MKYKPNKELKALWEKDYQFWREKAHEELEIHHEKELEFDDEMVLEKTYEYMEKNFEEFKEENENIPPLASFEVFKSGMEG